VKKSQASVVAACWRRKSRHELVSLRRRPQPVAEKDRPHRGRRDTDAEALQFAEDPSVAPGRVLACQSKNKRLYATIERRPPRRSVRIGPAPPDQLAVPAKQRRRTHKQSPQGAPRQPSRERSEDCPIHRPKLRSPRLPTQDRQLMPEHEDLEVLSSAPICPTARPVEASDRAPHRGTTKPRTTSGVRGARRYRATSQAHRSNREPSF
jgi:hypothetical protein